MMDGEIGVESKEKPDAVSFLRQSLDFKKQMSNQQRKIRLRLIMKVSVIIALSQEKFCLLRMIS
jgi:hypothetical protein